MKCQTCKKKTKTKDTRQYREPNMEFNWVERKIFCPFCNVASKTIEMPMDVWLKQIKESDAD